jgi:hypothetical protein
VDIDREDLAGFFEFMTLHLDERQRRLLAGWMARLLGVGCWVLGVGCWVLGVGWGDLGRRCGGMSCNTVMDGAKAFDAGELPTGRVHADGGAARRWRMGMQRC